MQTGPIGVGGFRNPVLSLDPDYPGMAGMLAARQKEHAPGAAMPESRWNGYKPMSANMMQSIGIFNRSTGPNPGSVVDRNRVEVSQATLHQGAGRPVEGGVVTTGTTHGVDQPPEIHDPNAVVDFHLHPNRGRRSNATPSMNDQVNFRGQPHLEHAIQVPGRPGSDKPQYVTANGAFPPRYYTLVPWPAGQPLPPPNSPDFNRMPPFRDPPFGYDGHIGSPLAPSSPSSAGSGSTGSSAPGSPGGI